jgi:hypothetical protein
VSEDQAKEIIETMFFLVNLSVDQIVAPDRVEDSGKQKGRLATASKDSGVTQSLAG